MKQQPVPIHTEYIQIDQLLKLEGVEAGYCREPMTAKATDAQLAKAKELKAKFL